jgi:tRNA uridine 5-carbamoylmethylation protein Kti12
MKTQKKGYIMSNAIIIEGPDCSGKSTLAKILAEKFNKKILHCDSKTMDEEIYNAIKDGYVLDRSHIGEYIYSEVFEREQQRFDKSYSLINKYTVIYMKKVYFGKLKYEPKSIQKTYLKQLYLWDSFIDSHYHIIDLNNNLELFENNGGVYVY